MEVRHDVSLVVPHESRASALRDLLQVEREHVPSVCQVRYEDDRRRCLREQRHGVSLLRAQAHRRQARRDERALRKSRSTSQAARNLSKLFPKRLKQTVLFTCRRRRRGRRLFFPRSPTASPIPSPTLTKKQRGERRLIVIEGSYRREAKVGVIIFPLSFLCLLFPLPPPPGASFRACFLFLSSLLFRSRRDLGSLPRARRDLHSANTLSSLSLSLVTSVLLFPLFSYPFLEALRESHDADGCGRKSLSH